MQTRIEKSKNGLIIKAEEQNIEYCGVELDAEAVQKNARIIEAKRLREQGNQDKVIIA
jgi:hypothetical protein